MARYKQLSTYNRVGGEGGNYVRPGGNYEPGYIIREPDPPGRYPDNTIIDEDGNPRHPGAGGFTIDTTPDHDPNEDHGLSGNPEDANVVQAIEQLRYRVESSAIYKQAYELFSSKDEYKFFLQRLVGILDSINVNSQTWVDRLGLSNNFNDSITEAYNYAIEQIQFLLQEFHQWYNSLPTTQVDQFQQAGVNSAITGQGLTGSSLNGQHAQRNFIESTDPLETLNSLSDIALNKIPSVVSTVSSVWKSIQDVRLADRTQDFNESSFLAGIRKSLIEQGFTLGDEQWNNLSDFHNWTERISSDPKLSKMFKDSSVGQFFSDLSYNGIMSVVGSNPDTWTERSFGKTFEEFYNDLGDFQIKTYFDQLEYSHRKAEFERNYISVRNGKTVGQIQNIEDEMRRFQTSFEKMFYENKLSFINTWSNRIKKSKDPVAKFALSKVLFGDNLVSGLDVGSDGLNAILDEYKKKGNSRFISPVGVGTNLGF